jgi:galactose-1-phosphate uridylyltransferase
MRILFAILFLGVVSSEVFNGDQWREVKSPLDSPRYHEIIKGIFPTISGRMIRGGRIAGGEFARLGQFVHQALLLNIDSAGDTYICGGSIISHNWILTVSLIEYHTKLRNALNDSWNFNQYRLSIVSALVDFH